jgi:hypothetical protein
MKYVGPEYETVVILQMFGSGIIDFDEVRTMLGLEFKDED